MPTLGFDSKSSPLEVTFRRRRRVNVTAVQNEPNPAIPSGGFAHRAEKAGRFGD
jgi:hypothetical protein